MTARDPQFEAAFSDLANALQVAAPLSTRVRVALGEVTEEAVSLEAAIERAVSAIRQLRDGLTQQEDGA